MSKKEIFIFDVDGVIIDSTDECLVVAWNAYVDYAKLNKNKINTPDESEESYAKHFRSIRNYVRSMDEYLLVFNTKPNEIVSQAKFEDILQSLDEKEKDAYGDCFFEARKSLKEKNKDKWLSLHHIYVGIVELFKKVQTKLNVYIVTGKDRESVVDFLNYFNIEFNINKIYDKKIARNKLIALEEIAKKEKVSHSEIIFLDDNITHLVKPYNAGFDVILADWGYGQKEHFKLAKELNIPILNIATIDERYLNETN